MSYCVVDKSANFGDETCKEIVEAGDTLPGWPRGVAHAYCKGTIELELKFAFRGTEGEGHKFFATLHRSRAAIERWDDVSQRRDEFDLPIGDGQQGDIEKPMLVRVVEFSKNSQEGRRILVSSIVRLRSLNPDLSFDTEVRQLPSGFFFIKGCFGVANRELEPTSIGRRVDSRIVDRRSVQGAIQGRSKIMDAVSSDQGPLFKRRRRLDINDERVAGTFSVTLMRDNVRITPTPFLHFSLERIEVLLRPSKF